jgi:hypothetical protein
VLSERLALDRPTPRRGLSRVDAATYLGISPSKFDELRAAGLISSPKVIGTRKIWDVRALDIDFDAFPDEVVNQDAGDWNAAV